MVLVNICHDCVKAILVLRIQNLVNLILVLFFDLAKNLDMIKFVFFDLNKINFELPPIPSILAQKNIKVITLADSIVFNTEINEVVILPKF